KITPFPVNAKAGNLKVVIAIAYPTYGIHHALASRRIYLQRALSRPPAVRGIARTGLAVGRDCRAVDAVRIVRIPGHRGLSEIARGLTCPRQIAAVSSFPGAGEPGTSLPRNCDGPGSGRRH